MLSESTHGGKRPHALWRALLESRDTRARMRGVAAGCAGIVLVALLQLALPASAAPLPLYCVAVGVVAWFGGRSPGVWIALAATLVQLAVDLASGATFSIAVEPWLRAAALLPVLVLIGRLLPPLRDALLRDRDGARTDPLTGLGNRRFFNEIAATELNRTRRYTRPLALLYLNVDRFRAVNDRLGHARGDELLGIMAHAIPGCLRTSDMVARITGDEFAVLLPETQPDGATVAAEKIRDRAVEALAQAGHPLTFSVAAVTYAEGAVALEPLLRQADALMQSVKAAGGNSVRAAHYEHPAVVSL